MNAFYEDVLWKIPKYCNTLTNSVSILSYCMNVISNKDDLPELLKCEYITILKFMKTIGDLSQVIFAVSQKIIHFTEDSACKTYSYLFIQGASDYLISSRTSHYELTHSQSLPLLQNHSYLRCCMEEPTRLGK